MVGETNLVISKIGTTPFVEWCGTRVETQTKKTRRVRSTAPTHIPIFKQCAELTVDSFWRKILEAAAEGKFPSRISYLNGCLYYKRGQHVEVFQLSLDPENARKEFMAFLQHWTELYSEVDMRQRHVDSFAERGGGNSDSWTSLGKRYRDQALAEFISKEIRRCGLTPTQGRQLSATLNIGITLRYFHNENIDVSNFSITKVHGLCFNSSTGKYYIHPETQQKKSRPTKSRKTSTKIKSYGDKWFAYHEQIQASMRKQDDSIEIPVDNVQPTIRIVERPTKVNSGSTSTDTDSEDSSNT